MRLTQLWMEYAAAACIGFLIDFIVGDPQGLWHPVCGIGSLISRMEKQLRRNVQIPRRICFWPGRRWP